MPEENRNKMRDWQRKLEEFNGEPGAAVQKDVAWDKLHQRLKGAKPSSKVAWYWLAAACILALVFVSVYTFFSRSLGDRDRAVIRKETALIPMVKKAAGQNAAIEKAPVKQLNISVSNIVGVASTVRAHQEAKVLTLAKSVIISEDPSMKAIVETKVSTHLSMLVGDTIATKTQVVVVQKRLPVVHLNELGEPLIEEPATVFKIDKHLKLKLSHDQVFADPGVISKTQDLGVISARL